MLLLLLAGCATWDYAYTPEQAAYGQQLIAQASYDQQRAIERQADYAYQVINQQTAAFQAQQQLNQYNQLQSQNVSAPAVNNSSYIPPYQPARVQYAPPPSYHPSPYIMPRYGSYRRVLREYLLLRLPPCSQTLPGLRLR